MRRSDAPKGNPFGIFRTIGIIFTLVGLLIFVLGAGLFLYAKRAESWPVVPGLVTRSGVATTRSSSGSGPSRTLFMVDVEYGYQVDGQNFSSETVSGISYSTNDREAVEEHADRYPVGSDVEVRYNPEDPSDAMLEVEWSWIVLIPFFLGAVFSTLGVGLIMVASRFSGAVAGATERVPAEEG